MHPQRAVTNHGLRPVLGLRRYVCYEPFAYDRSLLADTGHLHEGSKQIIDEKKRQRIVIVWPRYVCILDEVE